MRRMFPLDAKVADPGNIFFNIRLGNAKGAIIYIPSLTAGII
jgi:hypothetical protein